MTDLPAWLQIVGWAFCIGLVTIDVLVSDEASKHLALVQMVRSMLSARYQAMKGKVCWGFSYPRSMVVNVIHEILVLVRRQGLVCPARFTGAAIWLNFFILAWSYDSSLDMCTGDD